MKHHYLILLSMLLLFSCGPNKSDLEALAPTETFPEDTFLTSQENKKALIVVAHDDDLVAMSGTISKLNQQGWEVKQVAFVSESQERDEALKNAAPLIMDSVELIDIAPESRRSDLKPDDLPYMPIPKADFEKAFTNPALADALLQSIKAFEPTVIFSMDNEMGGYGHPEHIFVSQLLVDWFNEGTITPKRIYQTVYPNSMEEKIIKQRLTKLFEDWNQPNSYMTALKEYNITGMPEPTVEINIEDQSEAKMKFLRAFNERERQVIGFFVPHFEDFDHDEYFSVFNREFFRVVEKK